MVEAYVDELIRRIRLSGAAEATAAGGVQALDTVYIGGGTPTLDSVAGGTPHGGGSCRLFCPAGCGSNRGGQPGGADGGGAGGIPRGRRQPVEPWRAVRQRGRTTGAGAPAQLPGRRAGSGNCACGRYRKYQSGFHDRHTGADMPDSLRRTLEAALALEPGTCRHTA